MSKQSAMNMAMGGNAPQVTPSLVTGETPTLTPPAPGEGTVAQEVKTLDSDKFAAFVKKEAELLKRQELIKKEREEFLKEKQDLEVVKKRALDFDELWKKDKVQALKHLGASDEDIINIMASTQPEEETQEQKAQKIAKAEADKIREELKQEKAQLEKSQNERLVSNLKADIGKTIKDKAEKFEYCAFEGAEAELQAYEIIVENLKLNNELLSVEQALEIAEEYYETRDKAMASLKKRQIAVKPPVLETKEEVKPAMPAKSLTNNVRPTTAAIVHRGETRTQKRERLENALRVGGLDKI